MVQRMTLLAALGLLLLGAPARAAPWSAKLADLFGLPALNSLQEGIHEAANKKPHSECADPQYRKHALKLIKEVPFSGLFRDTKGCTKFEGSGMVEYEGKYLVVFDSLMALGVVDDRFQFRDPANVLLGDPGPESQFEGIALTETGTVLLLMESREHDEGYKPETLEVRIAHDHSGYEILRTCVVDFDLSHANKGFEGMLYHHDDRGSFLIGLCEGNHCVGGSKGREAGNGKLVISKYGDLPPSNSTTTAGGRDVRGDGHTHDCQWTPIKTVDIPASADFVDYSELALKAGTNKVAITSQESAALWIGHFDFEKWEFEGDGEVFHFPRNADCQTVYCNVEGISFIDDTRFIVTSDKSKSTQPYECTFKDQSVHIFALPA